MLAFTSGDLIDVGERHSNRPPPLQASILKRLFTEMRGAAATAKSLQSCLTLCDPVPGILQARTLEWVAISFSNA